MHEEESQVEKENKFILDGIKYLKYHKVSAYALMKMSMTCEYPISYPTVKKIYSEERIPQKRIVYLGFLEAIDKMVKKIQNNQS